LNGILRMIGRNRPLFFFATPGVILIIIGLLLGLDVLDRYGTFSQLALGRLLVAITLLITGLLSTFTGIILHTIRSYMTE